MAELVLTCAGRGPRALSLYRLTRKDGRPQAYPGDTVLKKLFARTFGTEKTVDIIERDSISLLLEMSRGTTENTRASFVDNVAKELYSTA